MIVVHVREGPVPTSVLTRGSEAYLQSASSTIYMKWLFEVMEETLEDAVYFEGKRAIVLQL